MPSYIFRRTFGYYFYYVFEAWDGVSVDNLLDFARFHNIDKKGRRGWSREEFNKRCVLHDLFGITHCNSRPIFVQLTWNLFISSGCLLFSNVILGRKFVMIIDKQTSYWSKTGFFSVCQLKKVNDNKFPSQISVISSQNNQNLP